MDGMKAQNEAVTEETRRQIARLQSLGWYHSMELPDGRIIAGHQTVDQLRSRLRQFPIPDDLTGKRVLDIGAWDGWFSFEMERRGAEVVAIDSVRQEKLLVARELLGSRVDYRVMSVYDLRPGDLGHFDIVLFLGVLYHLKHPLLALERVCGVSRDLVCIESFVTDDEAGVASNPCMEFYENTELCGQFDNWVGPNVSCLLSFCRTAGFARVALKSVLDNRAHVVCFRQWEPATPGGAIVQAPYITCVENGVSRDQVFSVEADDYVSIWFKAPGLAEAQPLAVANVFPEIGGFAAPPVSVHNTGDDGWQAVVKLSPGIFPGWTEVKLRIGDSPYSDAVSIAVDIDPAERERTAGAAPPAEAFMIETLTDGKTWERNRIKMGPDACVSIWVRGLPHGRRENVVVRLDEMELPSVFISEPDRTGLRQVNALVPPIGVGQVDISVAVGDLNTPPVRVEIVPA
jgi:tRNA (mo5U34)-methyltransferase